MQISIITDQLALIVDNVEFLVSELLEGTVDWVFKTLFLMTSSWLTTRGYSKDFFQLHKVRWIRGGGGSWSSFPVDLEGG